MSYQPRRRWWCFDPNLDEFVAGSETYCRTMKDGSHGVACGWKVLVDADAWRLRSDFSVIPDEKGNMTAYAQLCEHGGYDAHAVLRGDCPGGVRELRTRIEDGQKVWWCQEHEAAESKPEPCRFTHWLRPPCRMVEAVLVLDALAAGQRRET